MNDPTKKFLFIAWFLPDHLHTVKEQVEQFRDLSKYYIDILNVYHHENFIPSFINLNDYDGVIVHCTIAYSPTNFAKLDDKLNIKLKDYNGLKILIKQDEHVRTHETAKLIKEKKINLVLTCLADDQVRKAYPKKLVGDVEFMHIYTGYVSKQLRELKFNNLKSREFKIGYRGSIQPLSCGELGFEKRKIGYDVAKKCKELQIACDISSKWEDIPSAHEELEF